MSQHNTRDCPGLRSITHYCAPTAALRTPINLNAAADVRVLEHVEGFAVELSREDRGLVSWHSSTVSRTRVFPTLAGHQFCVSLETDMTAFVAPP